ncbi:MAG: ZIP family metal transporter [Flavobacteriaceae bacterium]|nr:ZIP family metal transporter [Flavobacteriaceae bacterium]
MNQLIEYFSSISPVAAALIVTLCTWFTTAVGASSVFFFKNLNRKFLDATLGFAAGIMMAASIFSLLIPSIKMTEGEGFSKVLPAVLGLLLGAFFIYMIDKVLPHLHINFKESDKEGIKTPWHKSVLLTLAITMHNIPEGLAIGVLFGSAAAGLEGASIGAAVVLGIGIAIQNIPEGFAISMPLRALGMSKLRSFNYGQLSAIVEPISAVIGAWAVFYFIGLLPYALSFAAGAMIFVVIEEVIPESQKSNHTDLATIAFIIGFCIMMTLDVGLTQ